MTPTEKELYEIARQFHAVMDLPHWASAGLAVAIEQTGCPVRDLTVGELLAIIDEHGERTNRILNEEAVVKQNKGHDTVIRAVSRDKTIRIHGVMYRCDRWRPRELVHISMTPDGPSDPDIHRVYLRPAGE